MRPTAGVALQRGIAPHQCRDASLVLSVWPLLGTRSHGARKCASGRGATAGDALPRALWQNRRLNFLYAVVCEGILEV